LRGATAPVFQESLHSLQRWLLPQQGEFFFQIYGRT
jgi:hypothetical protein